jgi:large subunit ribosomal protein L15
MKTKKRKKQTRRRGSHTQGKGFKKKARGKGNKGGKGMSGTGKRSDQKKTLILKNKSYFGKVISLGKKPTIKLKVINIKQILDNLPTMIKIKQANISGDKIHIHLKGYKILSEAPTKFDKKLIIEASAASKLAIKKIKENGGDILLEFFVKKKDKSSEEAHPQ